MSYHCKYISDPAFDDDDWRAYSNLMAELHRRYKSTFVNTTWQETRERVGSYFRQMPDHYRMMINMGTEMVGWADLRINNPGSESQTGSFISDVMPESPSRELADAVGREVAELAGKYGLETLHSFTSASRITRLIEWWQPHQIGTTVRYQLYRDKANMDAISKWLEDVPGQNPSLRLDLFKTIPDAHIERYLELFERFIREMPSEESGEMPFSLTVDEVRRQEKWRGENNAYWYTYALLDENDRLIGFSSGVINGSDPSDMYQAMTGVERPSRGRKLAKWLKAALFMKIGEDFPQNKTITTDMRAVNEPMLAINSQMGYIRFSEGREFLISVKGIRRSLDNIG